MGSINLKHTGSGSAIALSSDGTSLLLNGTAIGGGGGGADLYSANESSPTAQPSATGTNAIAIGDSATASGSNAIAVGKNSSSSGSYSFAGFGSANGNYSVALGLSTSANSERSVAIGNGAGTAAIKTVAIGYNSQASNNGAVAFTNSYTSGADSFVAAITNNSSSYGVSSTRGISIGAFSHASGSQDAISIGYASIGSATKATAVGYRNQATNTNAVALGSHARATGYYSLAISSATGDSTGALSSGIGSIAIGRTVTASHQDSAVLGNDVQSTATNQVSIGGSTQDVRISETYTLPKVDGTASGQVLTTDGSGAVSWATPSGGGSMNLISTQNISSAVSSIDFTSLGSYTRWKIIGSYKWSSGAIAALKLFDNGSLISGSQYSSYRTKDYDTPAIFNGAYGFLANNIGIQNASFIWDIIMVDGRPYVKMDTSGQASSSHASQEQCNTSGMLVDSYSLTSLTGFSVTATGGTCNTGQISLYGIST